MLVGNFEKNPKGYMYQDPVLWAWLEMFSPLRGTNSKTTPYLLLCNFRLNTLKSSAKAPAVDLLRLNTLRNTKTAFLTPQKGTKSTPSFLYRSLPLESNALITDEMRRRLRKLNKTSIEVKCLGRAM